MWIFKCRAIILPMFFLLLHGCFNTCMANQSSCHFDVRKWAESIFLDPNSIDNFPSEKDLLELPIGELNQICDAIRNITTTGVRRSILKEVYLPLCQKTLESYLPFTQLLDEMSLKRECQWNRLRMVNSTVSGRDIYTRFEEYKTVLSILQELTINSKDYPPHYGNLRYLEAFVFGNTICMDMKDPIPKQLITCFETLSKVEAGDELKELVSIVKQRSQDVNFLISNSELLITLSFYVPTSQMGFIWGAVSAAYLSVSRTQELNEMIKRVIGQRWGEEWIAKVYPIFEYYLENQILSLSNAKSFFTYKDSLLASGCESAKYLPHLCPEELKNSTCFEEYSDRYYRFLESIFTIVSKDQRLSTPIVRNAGFVDFQHFLNVFCTETLKRYYSTGFEFYGNIEKIRMALENTYGVSSIFPIIYLLEVYIPINVRKASRFANKMSMHIWLEKIQKSEDLTGEQIYAVSVLAYLYASCIQNGILGYKLSDLKCLIDWIASHYDVLGEVRDGVVYNVATALVLVGECKEALAWIERVDFNNSEYSTELKWSLYDIYYNEKDVKKMAEIPIEERSLSYYQLLQYFNCVVLNEREQKRMNYLDAFTKALSADFNCFFLMNYEDSECMLVTEKNRTSKLFIESVKYFQTGKNDNDEKKVCLKDKLGAFLYNWALASKGALLRSTKHLLSLLEKGLLREKYDFFRKGSSIGKGCVEGDNFDMLLNSNVSEAANEVMLDLVRKDTTGILPSFDFNAVKRQLQGNETAVEVIKLSESDYVALILRNNMEYPRFVALKNDTITDAYECLWKNIEAALIPSEKVYISLDGIFNVLNIECAKDPLGTMMMDKYDVYRVSTTLKIPNELYLSDIKKSVIYGNLTYEKQNMEQAQNRGALQVQKNQRYWGALKETKREIEFIKKTLEINNVECCLKEKNNGTKESFVALSNQNVDLLHLATHGFYNNVESVDGIFIPAMERAGLVLSGSAMDSVYSKSSGTIFANEISRLDLSSVKLLVLSACETAKGQQDIDGLIGLQRGFKQSGVGCMIMSLRTVNSALTASLMNEFYLNLARGLSVHKAFYKAQMKIKETCGNDDWNAFIILD